MAENKKSFLLYADLIHTVKKMPKEKQAELFMTILEYVNDENPIVDDILVDLVFEPIKQQLKRDLKGWDEVKKDRSESGRLGNLKRWNIDLYTNVMAGILTIDAAEVIAKGRIAIKPIAPIAVNGTVNVTDTVNDINRAKALGVAQDEIEKVTKDDYQKIVDENTGKELTEVVVVLKDFISKKPAFLEPYRDYWNIAVQKCNIPQVKSLTDTRLKKLKTRIREPDFDFVEIISKVRSSQKLKLDSAWFSFDWVLENQTNYTKILEGNYDN